MKKVLINENLLGTKLNQLLLYVAKKSNKMSLARYYKGKLTKEEFGLMQTEYKELILKEDKESRICYKDNINGYRDRINDFCGTEMSAEEYFNHHLKRDLENCNSLDYKEFKHGKYKPFNGTTSDFLCIKYTRNTPVTRGPVFEICYFEIGYIANKLISKMNKLFEYPHQIGSVQFEDLTFYKGETVVLGICPHEPFAYMNLEDDEYQELIEMGVLLDIIG